MKKLLLLATTVLFLTSCSTIIHGSKQKVTIKSQSNKQIIVYDKYGNVFAKGKGKLELELPKKSDIGFSKENYGTFGIEPKYNTFTIKTDNETKVLLPRQTAAYVYGNIFVPFGFLVDNITGAGINFEYNDSKAETLIFD